ncbi:NTP transferase domain-containing protein [Limibacter armeniacum]|uniref:NTP transferase domain-containing protein n=1 Tax=Limibacter armeniacum TaxID=466084 RepID=UPI002FE5AA36
MTTKKHQKHAKLSRTEIGKYARNEIAILGTPCGEIKKLALDITATLEGKSVAYLDMDHHSDAAEKTKIFQGFSQMYTDKIDFRRFDFQRSFNEFELRKFFNHTDLLLVNGNHMEAAAQLIVIDSRKKLDKHLPKVTNPLALIFQDGESIIPDALKKHYPSIEKLPQIQLSETQQIAQLVRDYLTQRGPKLKALVLAGGKSERMQQDKGAINYHGKPQTQHIFELLQQYTDEVYLSGRSDQHSLKENYPFIEDKFVGLGPFGGILSAFQQDPNAAWLVVAVDLPLLSEKSLDYLVANRNPSKVATAFISPFNQFPEPLITVWEPKAYNEMLQFLGWGYSCPRKVLINSDIYVIENPFIEEQTNVNTPEEMREVMTKLHK